MMKKFYILSMLLLAGTAHGLAQDKTDRDYLRSGNKLYNDSLFIKAEVDYRKALEINPKSTDAMFNLANALLMQQKAKEAAEKNMQVFILGVGSPDGSPIPVERGSNAFRKDKDGNVIVTRLNEAMCQEIAKAGNGMYIRVDNSNSAEKILNEEISKLAKQDVEAKYSLISTNNFRYWHGWYSFFW